MALSPKDYDLVERAVARGSRVAITRRGTQWIVVAQRLTLVRGREVLDARHPSTGEPMNFAVDDIEHIEVVK
ncbi:MAG: hypothetical protein ACT4P7_06820 [Gemmatimonadaceae bacterium]